MEMEFIFSPEADVTRNPKDHMGSYGYDDFEGFYAEVIANDGEEIVQITKVIPGYFDITFGSGITLHAISGQSITHKPV